MSRSRCVTSVIFSTALCFLVAGCASSGSLHRIEDAPLLPQEAGKDIRKFEVREQVAVDQKPAPQPEPRRKSKGQKPGKATKSFEYPNRRPKADPIWVGEQAIYDIQYLGVNAGQFSVKILPFKQINGRKVYHVFGEAKSSKVFSLFYSLRDTIETFIDYEAIAPHRFHIVLDESKQKRNSLELFDSEKGETFFWNRWNHHKRGYVEIKDYFPMQPLSQDSLSSLFYLRTVDLSDGAVAKFPVISEGKNWDAEVSVIRREMQNTPLGRVRTVVLKPETKYQGILKKQGDSFVWLTDDDRRLLVRLEAKVRIGTVVAVLRSFQPGHREVPADTVPTAVSPKESSADELLPPARKVRASVGTAQR
jgi:hypothetical protein